jgi:hypothetical protein
MKNPVQDLRNLLAFHGRDCFPKIFEQLDPVRSKGEFVISFFSRDDSRRLLALKSVALFGLEVQATMQNLIERFRRTDREDQLFVAHNLCHELKIGSLVASLAINDQDSNVYEIGPCFGFSSLQYSHLVKEKSIDSSKPISKLTAIERSKDFFEGAKNLKKMVGNWVGDIEYVLGDAIGYLRSSLRRRDIVFCCLAEPAVVLGILDLSRLRQLNIIVSYSKKTEDAIAIMRGRRFEDLLDPDVYDVYPFEDKKYNSQVVGDLRRIGLLALISEDVERAQSRGR